MCVPFHVEIPGNKKVDEVANLAITATITNFFNKMPIKDLKLTIKALKRNIKTLKNNCDLILIDKDIS